MMAFETGKKGKRPLLHVDLKQFQEPWKDWCSAHGLTPSEGVRKILAEVLTHDENLPEYPQAPVGSDDDLRRIWVRFSQREFVAATAAAEREGMSPSRFIVGLVRARLFQEHQFSDAERVALTNSNRRLLALTAAIKEGEGAIINRAQIEFLQNLVEQHVKDVSALLTANSKRWRR